MPGANGVDGGTSRLSRGAGFSLIEVIIVVAVISVLAAVAVPVVDLVQSRARTEATLREMDAHRVALEAYFRDSLRFPGSLEVLLKEGYLTGGFHSADASVDAWGTPYEYRAGNHTVTVRSMGPDRTPHEPNIEMELSGVPFLRERTREDMQTIRTALRNYERMRVAEGLPNLHQLWWNRGNPHNSALGTLILKKLLPNTMDYVNDAWGDMYLYSGSPADFVVSRNMDGGAGNPGRGQGQGALP